MVVGRFGHGRFGHGSFALGRFGHDQAPLDILATENNHGGRFGYILYFSKCT